MESICEVENLLKPLLLLLPKPDHRRVPAVPGTALSCHTALPSTSTDLKHPDSHSLQARPLCGPVSHRSPSLSTLRCRDTQPHITLSGISLYRITNICASVVPVTFFKWPCSWGGSPNWQTTVKMSSRLWRSVESTHFSTKHLLCI